MPDSSGPGVSAFGAFLYSAFGLTDPKPGAARFRASLCLQIAQIGCAPLEVARSAIRSTVRAKRLSRRFGFQRSLKPLSWRSDPPLWPLRLWADSVEALERLDGVNAWHVESPEGGIA